jgi:hypothetical protein
MDLNGTFIIIIYIYEFWKVGSHFVYQYIYILFDKMKVTSQITISTSFTSLWGKTENFKSTNFYIQSTLKLAYEHLEYQKAQLRTDRGDPNLSY